MPTFIGSSSSSGGGGGSAGITSIEAGSLIGLTSKDIDFSAIGDGKYLLRLEGMRTSVFGNVIPTIGFLDGGSFGTGQFLWRGYIAGIYQNTANVALSIVGATATSHSVFCSISGVAIASNVGATSPTIASPVDYEFEIYGGQKHIRIVSVTLKGEYFSSAFGDNQRVSFNILISGHDNPSSPYTSIDGLRLAGMSGITAGTYELFEVTD